MRRRATISWMRWWTLVVYGVLAALAVLSIPKSWSLLLDMAANEVPLSLLVLASLASLGAMRWAGRGRWTGFLGLRHFWTYPPLWVSVCIGVALVLGIRTAPWYGALILFPLVVGLISIVLHGASGSRTAQSGPATESASMDDFQSLYAWLRDDNPVSDPQHDMFEHGRIAGRIASRFDAVESPTIAVIGPFGSGKSTIKELTRQRLLGRHDIELVDVSLWPFESAAAAVVGILEALLHALGRHVNVLSLTGLPEEYLHVVEHAPGPWSAFAGLLRSPRRPQAVLSKMARVAAAIDVHFVLWIEDIERFAGGTVMRESEQEAQLAPIRALLYELHRVDHISVVLADTTHRTRFDLNKLARFIEHPPRLTTDAVCERIHCVRQACLTGYPRPIIDPAHADQRPMYKAEDERDRLLVYAYDHRTDKMGIRSALASLIVTPRALKDVLRLTLEVWESLVGEIDFDDVLVASALRVTRPHVFAFVDEHVRYFRSGFRQRLNARNNESSEHPVLGEFKQTLAGEKSPREQKAVEALVRFLLPDGLSEHGISDRLYIKKPQGVAVARHVDYWARYCASELSPSDTRDQELLKDIRAWKTLKDNGLLEHFLDEGGSAHVELFVSQFEPHELVRLLKALVFRLLETGDADWQAEGHPLGMIAVWRMCYARRPESGKLRDALCQVMPQVVEQNLPLAQELLHFFGESSGSESSLIERGDMRDVTAAALEAFCRNVLPSSMDKLVSSLGDGSPNVVFWFVGFIGKDHQSHANGTVVPFPRWPEFASQLLDLLEKKRALGLRIVLPFITKAEHRITNTWDDGPKSGWEWAGDFNEAEAPRLFDVDRLVSLLAEGEVPEEFTGEIQVRAEAAIAWAKMHRSE